MNRENCLLLTAIVATFLMLVVLIAMAQQLPTVACASIGGLMTVLTVYIWRRGDGPSDGNANGVLSLGDGDKLFAGTAENR